MHHLGEGGKKETGMCSPTETDVLCVTRCKKRYLNSISPAEISLSHASNFSLTCGPFMELFIALIIALLTNTIHAMFSNMVFCIWHHNISILQMFKAVFCLRMGTHSKVNVLPLVFTGLRAHVVWFTCAAVAMALLLH